MMRSSTIFLFCAFFVSGSSALAQHFKNPDTLGPDVPTPPQVIDRMLTAARLKPGEMVYDLGCGEGRVVMMAAQKFKARAVGIELSQSLFEQTFNRVKQLGLENQITIVHGNALHYDLSPADVVTIYFLTSSNDRLRPVFEKTLRPGARVVSHDYEIRGWKPAIKETMSVNGGRVHTIYVYDMGRHASE